LGNRVVIGTHSNGYEAQVDRIASGLVVIAGEHSQIHNGQMFSGCKNYSTVANAGTTPSWRINTGSSYAHLKYIGFSSSVTGVSQLDVYEASTGSPLVTSYALGTQQVETATGVGSCTGSGNLSIVVTAAGMTNSPKTLLIPILNGDTLAQWIVKASNYMNADADVSSMFVVTYTATTIIMTRKTDTYGWAYANDSTLNMNITTGTATGITTAATSANTTAGSSIIGTPQVETATVTAGSGITLAGNATVVVTASGLTGSPKTYNVAVALSDTAANVATKISTALNADAALVAMFTISPSTATVVLTRKTGLLGAYTNDSTLNVSIDNGTCTGITTAATSADTTAGVIPTNLITPYNRRRYSVSDFPLLSTSCAIYDGITNLSGGTQIETGYYTSAQPYGNRMVEQEIVLSPNSVYCIKVTNSSGGNANYSNFLLWYETSVA